MQGHIAVISDVIQWRQASAASAPSPTAKRRRFGMVGAMPTVGHVYAAYGSGGEAPPEPAVSTQRPAGKTSKQRLRVVEIDGVDHVVSSEAEAQALIDKAKEAAEELAKLAVERAAKAQKRPARKVLADARKTLAPIEIKAPVELQPLVDQALAEIQAIYKSAINTIEISTLLRKREAEEEDDEDVLLLL